jgi:voltage-gated potassium channel
MSSIRTRLKIFLVVFLAVIVCGTLGFMAIEDISIADAFYFSIVTISTVGYGDIHPATSGGKILAVFLIILGVGTFLGVIANATELFLSRRETTVRVQKLNMVIGTFFSEVGTRLLKIFCESDPGLETIQPDLVITNDWSDEDFKDVANKLKSYTYDIGIEKIDLKDLREYLLAKRDFLVRLLENPALLEHETFTDLLRAVFHATEELAYRENLGTLPQKDLMHLAGDLKRAYNLLVYQWVDYMRYMKDNYPYLFSLAMRTNPFDRKTSPIIT